VAVKKRKEITSAVGLYPTAVCYLDAVVGLMLRGPEEFLIWSEESTKSTPYGRAYFSVHYCTQGVLLKAGCATLKKKMCNIKFVR